MKYPSFDKVKKLVKKRYPSAKSSVDTNGKYFVADNNGKLLQEYMIPNQNKLYDAWWWVYDVIRINQNIERTHPDRMVLDMDEEKAIRVMKRMNKRKFI